MSTKIMDKLNIGIVGLGFVGDAIYHALSTKDADYVHVIGYDKYKYGGIGTLENLLNCDWLFICLPTQFNCETQQYNLEPMHDICQQLEDANYQGICLVKSTVEPKTCQEFANQYGLKIIHNPEFLTARTAREDFAQQSHIVLGPTNIIDATELEKITQNYQQLFPQAHISTVQSIESEAMKLFVNNFYAIKVQFFTELYQLCQKIEADYNTVVNLMLRNGWISPHHTKVPGPDGLVSYGGMCFPKDTQALLSFMDKMETPHKLLASCVKERNEMRDD